jgi:hypothetical protein
MFNSVKDKNFTVYLNNKMKQELMVPDLFELAKEVEEYKKKLEKDFFEKLSQEYFNIGYEFLQKKKL